MEKLKILMKKIKSKGEKVNFLNELKKNKKRKTPLI
jgi:hypothetical protein